MAYLDLAKLYHPDKQDGDADSGAVYEASQYFLLISEAYDVLGNQELREKYDEAYLHGQKMVVYDHPFADSRHHAAY